MAKEYRDDEAPFVFNEDGHRAVLEYMAKRNHSNGDSEKALRPQDLAAAIYALSDGSIVFGGHEHVVEGMNGKLGEYSNPRNIDHVSSLVDELNRRGYGDVVSFVVEVGALLGRVPRDEGVFAQARVNMGIRPNGGYAELVASRMGYEPKTESPRTATE